MAHTIEPAASGRAKCRGCGRAIAKGELRFGQRFPNPFSDEGEMTLWLHLMCGAYKRPEALLEALEESAEAIEDKDRLVLEARKGLEHECLPRAGKAERSPTGRARCRSCGEVIAKDGWRVQLVFFEEDRFVPSGFIHAACAHEYFGTRDLLERLRHFDPDLKTEELAELEAALG